MGLGMAKSPQPAAAKQPEASRCESARKITDTLGGGEVRLYNLKKHPLPDVVNTPPEKALAECDCWLVHFPSRQCVAVPGGRAEGLRLLKKLAEGKDEQGWLPRPEVKKARARTGARVCVIADGDEGETQAEAKPKVKKFRGTPVAKDMDFEKAMKHVFPNGRITREIEKLLVAEDPVFDKEGNEVGYKPAHMVRKEAVKLMIEHAQGRAGEKPAPQPDKKKVTYDELETMILGSQAARMYFKRLIEKAEAVPVVVGPVMPAAEVKG